MIKENTLANVSYQKVETRGNQVIHGEHTHRVVLPTYVPQPKHMNVKAIDVTGLSAEDRETVLNAWNSYQEYLTEQRKSLFAFEQFVEQTGGTLPELKWRTFKMEQLTETK